MIVMCPAANCSLSMPLLLLGRAMLLLCFVFLVDSALLRGDCDDAAPFSLSIPLSGMRKAVLFYRSALRSAQRSVAKGDDLLQSY